MKLHNLNTNILIKIYEHSNSEEFRTGFAIVPSANFKALCIARDYTRDQVELGLSLAI